MPHTFISITLSVRLFSRDYHDLSLGTVTVLLEKAKGQMKGHDCGASCSVASTFPSEEG